MKLVLIDSAMSAAADIGVRQAALEGAVSLVLWSTDPLFDSLDQLGEACAAIGVSFG